jgi:iron-sulfur cluster assembly protein
MMTSTESSSSAAHASTKPAEPTSSEGTKKLSITCSPKAVEAMRAQLDKRGTPDAAIRVGIRGGGCSGFSYVIEFDDAPPRQGDLVLEYPEEGKTTVHVHCDKKSLIYLAGTVLDWEKTLMYQGFKFRNPQEATSCGCGHSFTVA